MLVNAGAGRVIARIRLVDKVDMLPEASLEFGAHDLVKIWSSLLHRNSFRKLRSANGCMRARLIIWILFDWRLLL
jgi:hypothetical protein